MPPQPVPTPLITDPLSIFIFLIGLVGFIFYISELRPLQRVFHYFPPLVFCYFLPMIATTLRIIPNDSPLYPWVNKVFLAPLLILLLLSADVRAILKLGPRALGVMLAGSLGIVLGALVGFFLFQGKVDVHAWQNIGSLAASWTGGSANMMAVRSAYQIPNEAFAPMVVIDTVLAYSWMGIVIAMAPLQEAYARRVPVNQALMAQLEERARTFNEMKQRPVTTRDLLVMLSIAFVGGYLCSIAGGRIGDAIKPLAKSYSILGTFSGATLTVIFATIAGLALSFTPVAKFEEAGASKIGYALLFLLLPTFGAQANLREFERIPWYAAIGATMLVFHILFIFVAMVLTKSPLVLGAAASQANVGGPASAAVVTTAYQPALAPVGILLGIFGGVIGTFIGMATAELCRMIGGK